MDPVLSAACRSRRQTGFFVGIVVFFLSAPLWGTERQQTAKQKFDEGIALVTENRYERALEAFQTSYGAAPRPMILFNIGMCLKALSRYTEALLTFRRYFAEAGASPKPDMREPAKRAITEIEDHISYLAIKGDAPDAALTIDETVTLQLPLAAPHPIRPGRHEIVVFAPGYERFETDIQTTAKETASIEVRLVPLSALVRVTCDAGDSAEVLIDGTRVGTCPHEGKHPIGEHRLEVKQPGQPAYSETIVLQSDKRLERQVPEMKTERNAPKTVPVTSRSGAQGLLAQETVVVDPPLKWRVMGWTAAVLGAGALAVGVTFTVEGAQDNRKAEKIAERYETAPTDEDYWAHYTLRTKDIPRDQAWIIAGYCTGFALLGASAIMLYIDAKRRRVDGSKKHKKRLSLTGDGVALHF